MSGRFQDHPDSWAAAIATLSRHKLPLTTEGATAAKNTSGQQAAVGCRVPVTAHHVRAIAAGCSNQNEDEVLVTIKVDDQYHINANPASFDFPIPTSVAFKGVNPSTIEYPRPARFTAQFAPEGLDDTKVRLPSSSSFRKAVFAEAARCRAASPHRLATIKTASRPRPCRLQRRLITNESTRFRYSSGDVFSAPSLERHSLVPSTRQHS
jgi:hypothetical protein